MFCPHCKCEYRQGFTTCADCNVELVAEVSTGDKPAHDPPSDNSSLVPVFETHNQGEIAIIKSALAAEKIVFHFSGERFNMMGVRPLPARLLVESNRRDEVHALLRELEFIA